MKKGFISTSIVYAVLIVFLLMLTTLFLMYFNSRMLLKSYTDDLKTYLIDNNSYSDADIIVNLYYKSSNGSYVFTDEAIDDTLYNINDGATSCTYSDTTNTLESDEYSISYSNSNYEIRFNPNSVTEQIICNLYFDEV